MTSHDKTQKLKRRYVASRIVRTDQVRRDGGKTVRANKKRCDTLSDIAPIRASRSSVKKILLKNS
ncbi:hypothetical protein [Paraburkholderia sp.]|uniref:hypothetical protein n=1 Tax=Paraburkholderia sp. TaxID=1926495 RepID=UPI002AFF5F84|nr:hypothetical protein [Paraburkholderia sp.]